MARSFQSFVILGAMRTGSNFLEASLNEIEGISSYGEVFNPEFIGRKNATQLFGIDLKAREADPLRLLARMREKTEGLSGFRFFQGHDPRILEAVLADPGCAKIVLTRNPLDSFVSLGIAAATDQWMLRNEKNRRTAKIRFDGAAFAAYLDRLEAFYGDIRHRLQLSGQAAFPIGYADLADAGVLNGLAAWLGVKGRLEKPSATLKRQNPEPLAHKVENPEDIAAALARLDLLDPGHEPALEPVRRPAVSSYVAPPEAPLLYLPVRSGPVARVEAWLAALDAAEPQTLQREFNRKTLRAWRGARPGHLCFTVIRHPLARAHEAFSANILATRPGNFAGIRARLRELHGLDLPEGKPDESYTAQRHHAAFLGFLRFLKANLAGQTSIRIDPVWASQEAILKGFSAFHPPDMVIRDERLAEGLKYLAAQIGREAPALPREESPAPYRLDEIHDAELEAAARAAYGRDYAAFGYDDWGRLRRP
jgi:LPS sulfotransferase NodH